MSLDYDDLEEIDNEELEDEEYIDKYTDDVQIMMKMINLAWKNKRLSRGDNGKR